MYEGKKDTKTNINFEMSEILENEWSAIKFEVKFSKRARES